MGSCVHWYFPFTSPGSWKEALIQQKEWTADQEEMAAAGMTLWVILSLPAHDTKLTGNNAPQDSTLMEAYGFLHAYLLATQIHAFTVKFYLGIAVSQFKQRPHAV